MMFLSVSVGILSVAVIYLSKAVIATQARLYTLQIQCELLAGVYLDTSR